MSASKNTKKGQINVEDSQPDFPDPNYPDTAAPPGQGDYPGQSASYTVPRC